MNNPNFNEIPLWLWVSLLVTLFVQAIFLFIDARKRNAYPWFWGVFGIFSFPLPIILYAILVRKIFSKNKNQGGYV